MPLGAEFSPQGSEPTFLVAEKCRLASFAVTSSGRWASAENPCRRGRGYARRPGTSSALMRFVLFTGSRVGGHHSENAKVAAMQECQPSKADTVKKVRQQTDQRLRQQESTKNNRTHSR